MSYHSMRLSIWKILCTMDLWHLKQWLTGSLKALYVEYAEFVQKYVSVMGTKKIVAAIRRFVNKTLWKN